MALSSQQPALDDVSCSHQIEGAVWGDERDRSVIFKARKPDTLMELHVLEVHSFILGAPPLCFKQHLCKWRAHVFAMCCAP